MAWIKRGLVFDPTIHAPWVHSHAQVPTAFEMKDHIRVFYAGRNAAGTSFTTYVDLKKSDPSKILYVSDKPIAELGKTGTFDDEGMMPSDIVGADGRIYFFYSGWNRRLTSPYHNATGVLFSDDNGETFYRPFDGPVLDRIATEPYLAVTPTVILENGLWRMWYVSGVGWESIDGRFEPVYVIKYAHSRDGITWARPPEVCIAAKHPLEAFSRPRVLKERDGYCMWFCHRESEDYRGGKGAYRLSFATSVDGIKWNRELHSLELIGQEESWEREMQCYPYVIEIGAKRYMFYNGNGFGRSGFGLAEWVA